MTPETIKARRLLNADRHSLSELTFVDHVASRDLMVFSLIFHSSLALQGARPYVRSPSELNQFKRCLEGVLEHTLARQAATPMGLSQVPAHVGNSILQVGEV